MSPEDAITIGRDFFYHAILLALPALLVSLVLGLLISVFQAATSIQEQTLTFVPRVLALALLLTLTMPWMIETVVYYTTQMFWRAAQVGH